MKKLPLTCGLVLLLAACSSQPEVEVPEKYAELENLKAFPANPEPQTDITLNHGATYSDSDEVALGAYISGINVNAFRITEGILDRILQRLTAFELDAFESTE